jgi:hypothetical protein
MLVAPVSRSAIVIGKCLGGATVSTFQGIVILAPAGLAHVPYDPILPLTVIGGLPLLSFTLTAFGVMMAARAPRPRERCPVPGRYAERAAVPAGVSPGIAAVVTLRLSDAPSSSSAQSSSSARGKSGYVDQQNGPKKGDAGWLRGQTTRRRYHRRSDGGPERRQRCPDGGPEHRYEWYTADPPYVSRPMTTKSPETIPATRLPPRRRLSAINSNVRDRGFLRYPVLSACDWAHTVPVCGGEISEWTKREEEPVRPLGIR